MDSRGYTVAAGKDKISTYLSGRSFPTPIILEQISRALGVEIQLMLAREDAKERH